MPTATRYVVVSQGQADALRELELSPLVNSKVRLRASIVRLNNAGWNAEGLAEHFKRSPQSIHNDLDRFEQDGIAGLSDGKSSGQPAKFTPPIIEFIHQQLQQDRIWNSSLLHEEIQTKFAVSIQREAIRLKLLELGYSWKRTRYTPGKKPDPAIVAQPQAELERLKRGHWIKP